MRNMKLSKHEIKDIIQRLQNGDTIPEDYKYKLFPTKQKEYELVYGGKMRKEDILANEDGVFPVPLQIEKVFNGERESWDDGWKNIIAFGDNLQFLKTIYENKDPLIKNKVKGKVKLIYIDPPFGTGDEYDGNNGQKGYSARMKGAEFVEFLRKRLIVSKDILKKDGFIIVRQAYNFGYEIKLIMDEIFGKNNFRNEILINKANRQGAIEKRLNPSTEFLFLYSLSSNSKIIPTFKHRESNSKWINMHSPKQNKFKHNIEIEGVLYTAPKGRHWTFSQKRVNELIKDNRIRMVNKIYIDVKGKKQNKMLQYLMDDKEVIESNWTDIPGYSFTTKYPTENSEQLIERVIKMITSSGELVFDFFGGSGSCAAVAEKLNRKWITCDIGKLSFYTIQKRILNIEKSKSLANSKKKYGKCAKSFVTVNTGAYDLEKVFKLQQEEYTHFVLNLFEVEAIRKTIGGIKITGERKDGYYALVWPYWDFKDAAVDVEYLENLHSHIGKKAGDRLYIIAPASYVDFISDYYEVGKVRYYFLKVPYHIIKELHKVQFKKFRQPQSKNNVNDLDDAVGFHFMKQPNVVTNINKTTSNVSITIDKFLSDFSEDEKGEDLANFESLAMVLIDKDFDGKAFDMDEYYFAEDLLPKDDVTENILLPSISKDECGKRLMVIYVDIFGNEFKEVFEIK